MCIRDSADPEQMKEGCERLQEAIDLGKERGMYVLAMMVLDVYKRQPSTPGMAVLPCVRRRSIGMMTP